MTKAVTTETRNSTSITTDTAYKADTPSELNRQLGALNTLDTKTLRKLWQRCHGRLVPPALSRDLIIRMIAFKLQEKALGGLSAAMKRKLRLLATQLDAGKLQGGSGTISLKPGTKLIRSWHGETFEVLVLEKGFEMKGKRYSSLSKIASEITGTKWSGPRFFGLKKKTVPTRKPVMEEIND